MMIEQIARSGYFQLDHVYKTAFGLHNEYTFGALGMRAMPMRMVKMKQGIFLLHHCHIIGNDLTVRFIEIVVKEQTASK